MALELQAAWGETMHVGLHPWAPWTMACPPTRSWDFRQVQGLPATSGCPIAANQEAWLLPQQLLDLCKQQQGVLRKTSRLNRLPWDTKGGSAAAAWWAICPAGWTALQGWLQEDQETSVYMYASRLQREEIRCHRGQLALSFNQGKGRLPLKMEDQMEDQSPCQQGSLWDHRERPVQKVNDTAALGRSYLSLLFPGGEHLMLGYKRSSHSKNCVQNFFTVTSASLKRRI